MVLCILYSGGVWVLFCVFVGFVWGRIVSATLFLLIFATGMLVNANFVQCSPRWSLKQEVPKIVKSINRQLREKSIKTKVRIVDIYYRLSVM